MKECPAITFLVAPTCLFTKVSVTEEVLVRSLEHAKKETLRGDEQRQSKYFFLSWLFEEGVFSMDTLPKTYEYAVFTKLLIVKRK